MAKSKGTFGGPRQGARAVSNPKPIEDRKFKVKRHEKDEKALSALDEKTMRRNGASEETKAKRKRHPGLKEPSPMDVEPVMTMRFTNRQDAKAEAQRLGGSAGGVITAKIKSGAFKFVDVPLPTTERQKQVSKKISPKKKGKVAPGTIYKVKNIAAARREKKILEQSNPQVVVKPIKGTSNYKYVDIPIQGGGGSVSKPKGKKSK